MTARGATVTVPEAVRQILTRNYPVYQCLKMKVVNYHSLADRIKDQVQDAAGRRVATNTLVVAIKRFADTLDPIGALTLSDAFKGARISLSSGMVDVTLQASKSEFPRIVKEIAEVGSHLSEFPHVFPLSTTIKIILLAEDYDAVKKSLDGVSIIESREGVARLTLHFSLTGEMTQGMESYINELLYQNGVKVLDAFLGHRDVIMVVSGEDGPIAFNILQKEIDQSIHKPPEPQRPQTR